MSRKPPTNCSRGFSGERRTTGRTALLQLSHKGAMWLYRKLGRVHGRIRFFKHYCVARKRSADLKSIETFVHERLIHQYSNAPIPAPNIGVTFQLLAQDGRYRGVYFDAPIVVMVTLDATPAFGMAFEVRGKDLRIRQLHGVRGISFRGRYNALRPWPRLFVHACQDLAMACGYKRVMVVRSHRSYSWPRPSNRNGGPSTPEGVSENAELRLRLIKRLDETAKSIDGFEMGTQWWIWRNPVAEKYRTSLIDRSRTRVLAGITGFAATLVQPFMQSMDQRLDSTFGKLSQAKHTAANGSISATFPFTMKLMAPECRFLCCMAVSTQSKAWPTKSRRWPILILLSLRIVAVMGGQPTQTRR
jgi:hypothetical protein